MRKFNKNEEKKEGIQTNGLREGKVKGRKGREQKADGSKRKREGKVKLKNGIH